MSYSPEDLGADLWSLPQPSEDIVERLARATDILDLLRRADEITPPEIDLWCALVLHETPKLYVHCPAPLSPTLALAIAQSMGEEAAIWGSSDSSPRAVAEHAQLSFVQLSERVLTGLSDAWHDHVTRRSEGIVAVTRAAATDARGLTLDRWRDTDEALEVAAWLIGALCDEKRPPSGIIDPLTGVHTREFFHEVLRHELCRGERQPTELSVMLLQLRRSAPLLADQRPPIELLATTASIVRRHLRRADVVARLDSHRLAALLPSTGPRDGLIAASRVGEALHEVEELVGWSIDIGVSGVGMETASPDELLNQAAHAMLSAQRGSSTGPFIYV